MAYKKFESSDRGKRPAGDKKSFIAKFKRKGDNAPGGEKPGYEKKKEEGNSFSPARKIYRGGEKPGYGKRREEGYGASPDRKRYGQRDDDRRKPFSKKPYKPGEGKTGESKESFDRPRYGANRAFSAPKKYFKKKEDSATEGGEERKRPFDKDFKAPYRGRAKSFAPPRFDRSRKFSSSKKRDVMSEKPKDGLIRLNKYISNSGVCSRREADELIKMGLISVNGQVITEMGFKVKPTDDVRHESKRLAAEKQVYILLNKPKGFITTTDDPQERKTVMSLIGTAVKERIYPVGRLDRNTTGLLLLTNDGDIADKLTHPSYKAKKIYKVELDKPLTKADFEKIIEGIRLEEGKVVVDDLAFIDDDKKNIGIELHIGWNRIVRRIFEFLGYEVVKLDRVVYAGLDKKNLGRGEWRFLKQEEVVKLKHLNKG